MIPKSDKGHYKKGIKENIDIKGITNNYASAPTERSVQEVIGDGLKFIRKQ